MSEIEKKSIAVADTVRTAMKSFEEDKDSRLCVLEAYCVLKPLLNEIEKNGYARETPPEEIWDGGLIGEANNSIFAAHKQLGIDSDKIEDAGAEDITIDLCTLSGIITDSFVDGAVYATKYPRPKPYKQ